MRVALSPWLAFLRPGDWVVAGAGLLLSAYAAMALWQVVAQVELKLARTIEVVGPLGVTVIEIQPGRARVSSDPGPRQYCVRQGWLSQAGAVAICAPNEVSLSLTGRSADYDSLNY